MAEKGVRIICAACFRKQAPMGFGMCGRCYPLYKKGRSIDEIREYITSQEYWDKRKVSPQYAGEVLSKKDGHYFVEGRALEEVIASLPTAPGTVQHGAEQPEFKVTPRVEEVKAPEIKTSHPQRSSKHPRRTCIGCSRPEMQIVSSGLCGRCAHLKYKGYTLEQIQAMPAAPKREYKHPRVYTPRKPKELTVKSVVEEARKAGAKVTFGLQPKPSVLMELYHTKALLLAVTDFLKNRLDHEGLLSLLKEAGYEV